MHWFKDRTRGLVYGNIVSYQHAYLSQLQTHYYVSSHFPARSPTPLCPSLTCINVDLGRVLVACAFFCIAFFSPSCWFTRILLKLKLLPLYVSTSYFNHSHLACIIMIPSLLYTSLPLHCSHQLTLSHERSLPFTSPSTSPPLRVLNFLGHLSRLCTSFSHHFPSPFRPYSYPVIFSSTQP